MGRQHMIRFRRDTAANWAAANPVLALGEPGFETDTGVFKIGDGVTAWATLLGADVSSGGAGTGRLITSRFYEAPVVAISTAILGEGQGFYNTFWQPAGFRIDDLSIDITVVGTAGALIRLGAHAQGTDGEPGDVLVDAGTVDGTVLGFGTLPAVVAAPAASRLVFLAFAIQGAAGTRPTVRIGTALPSGPGGTTLSAELTAIRGSLGTALAAVPGAFAANPTLSTGGVNAIPRVFVRGTQF